MSFLLLYSGGTASGPSTTYSADFSGDSVTSPLSNPTGWTLRWAQSNSVWGVESGGLDKVVHHISSSNEESAISLNAADAATGQIEALTLFSPQGTTAGAGNGGPGIALYCSGSPGGSPLHSGNICGLKPDLDTLYISIVTANDYDTTYISAAITSLSVGSWYYLRYRIDSANYHMAKIWAKTDSEPADWTLGGESDSPRLQNSAHTSGWKGIREYNAAIDTKFDYFSIGMDGTAAPLPPGGGGGTATAPISGTVPGVYVGQYIGVL